MWLLLRSRSEPCRVKAKALRPFLVGRTQSNMSTPAMTAARISTGMPTPIR